MKHARSDYDRIQDPAGLIPEDEPVFLIRGCDAVGPRAVEDWAERAENAGAQSNITAAARAQAEAMRAYQCRRGAKVPDMPQERAKGNAWHNVAPE